MHYLYRLSKLEVQFQKIKYPDDYNYAYFPVVFKSEKLMLESKEKLELAQIYCRRYFYPSLSALPYVNNCAMPVCESIASRILCLPLYHSLATSDLDLIARMLMRIQNFDGNRKEEPAHFGNIELPQIALEINNHRINVN